MNVSDALITKGQVVSAVFCAVRCRWRDARRTLLGHM